MRCGTVPLRQAQGEKAHRRLSLLCWHSVQAEQGQPPGFRNGAGGAGKSVLPAGLCRFVGMPVKLGRTMQCAAMAHAARCAGRCSTLHRASHRSALSGAKGWGGWCTGIPPSPAHSPCWNKKGCRWCKMRVRCASFASKSAYLCMWKAPRGELSYTYYIYYIYADYGEAECHHIPRPGAESDAGS